VTKSAKNTAYDKLYSPQMVVTI